MDKNDQLVRLNIGAAPDEINILDWVFMTGDLLYLLVCSSGEVRYLHVPLDMEMLRSVRESTVRKENGGLYRDIRGEPTLLATYLALFFLDRDVSVPAIRRELGLSDMTMNWLLDVRQYADGVIERSELLKLIRLLTFEGDGQI
ncbi:hypothetical protein [Caballeronia arvi]|uniref:hypothetical protein n=1 Tax=Caballeronia arvi TaxID=1777135 RepID=UPI00077274F3|nr:hypothetical protein [Caballeronia arvi]